MCTRPCSGGKFLDTVLEHDAVDDVGEELRSVQCPPIVILVCTTRSVYLVMLAVDQTL